MMRLLLPVVIVALWLIVVAVVVWVTVVVVIDRFTVVVLVFWLYIAIGRGWVIYVTVITVYAVPVGWHLIIVWFACKTRISIL